LCTACSDVEAILVAWHERQVGSHLRTGLEVRLAAAPGASIVNISSGQPSPASRASAPIARSPARLRRPGGPDSPRRPCPPRPAPGRNDVVGHLLSLPRQQVPNHDTGLRRHGTRAARQVTAEAYAAAVTRMPARVRVRVRV
jgi:hypothetical protein